MSIRQNDSMFKVSQTNVLCFHMHYCTQPHAQPDTARLWQFFSTGGTGDGRSHKNKVRPVWRWLLYLYLFNLYLRHKTTYGPTFTCEKYDFDEMADNHLKNLRRLAKRYHIRFSLPSDTWPECHADTFKNIEELGRYRFDTYAQNTNIRSAEEPWTRQTKSRAEWLTNRAGSLFKQNRNEAGWRFAIENDVLRRFSAEVAWYVFHLASSAM